MLNRTCREFIDVLASREPVPGGGGASALAGAVGIALGAMVGELTVGKKKYAEHEAEISNLIFRSQELIQKFDELVTKDAEAFLPCWRPPIGCRNLRRKKRGLRNRQCRRL